VFEPGVLVAADMAVLGVADPCEFRKAVSRVFASLYSCWKQKSAPDNPMHGLST
jgi:hypothetical protein